MKASGHMVSPRFEVLKNKLSRRDPLANHHHFTSKKLHHSPSSLAFVTLSAIIAMAIMLGIQFVTVAIWPNCTPGTPCKDKKGQLEIFADIIDQREHPRPDRTPFLAIRALAFRTPTPLLGILYTT